MRVSGPFSGVDVKIRRWLGAFVFLISCIVVFDANDGNTDAEVHFQQIRAMAEHRSFSFEPDSDVTRLIIEMEGGPLAAGAASQRGRDGRVYGHFGVYYVFCALPFYYLGGALEYCFPRIEQKADGAPFLLNGICKLSNYWRRLAVTFISPLFLAIAASSIFSIARRLGAARGASLAAALAFSYATFAGVQARHGGSDTMAAGLLAFALERVLAARDDGRRALVHAGIAAGLLFGSRYLAIAVLPGVIFAAVFVIWRRDARRRERALDAAAAAVPFVVLSSFVLYCNWARWGGVLDFGYVHSFATDKVLTFSVLEAGPRGLLLSFLAPSRGLVYFAAPAVVLGTAGILLLFRKDPRIALSLLIGIVATVVPPSLSIIWNGTWSYGPRYHLSSLIYFAPAAAVAIDAAARRGKLWLSLASVPIAAGAILIFPAFITSPFGFLTLANDAIRIDRPPSSYDSPLYQNSPELVEADHQEFLPVAPFTSPYNALLGQWRFLGAALAGDTTFPVRDYFNIKNSNAVLPLLLIEHSPRNSPWWRTMAARTGSRGGYLAAAALAAAAIFAMFKIRRCFASDAVS